MLAQLDARTDEKWVAADEAADLMTAHRLSNRREVQATLSQRRAIVYITVEWAVQERHSRKTFAEFVKCVEEV